MKIPQMIIGVLVLLILVVIGIVVLEVPAMAIVGGIFAAVVGYLFTPKGS